MSKLKAFHGDKALKARYLARVRAHKLADEIIKGQYWAGGKGCAVGCTIHSSKHKDYETELGIPEWLARVEDVIFEGLPNDKAKEWPHQFLKAINVGADLSTVEAPFVIFVLESNLQNFDNAQFPEVVTAINRCIELYKVGDLAPSDLWSATESAAWRAAWSAAWSAARSAAWSAAWSAARSAAESAAWRAAWSAARSAAESAAWSAARGAARSAAESAARSAARGAAYEKFAEKLLALLKGCK